MVLVRNDPGMGEIAHHPLGLTCLPTHSPLSRSSHALERGKDSRAEFVRLAASGLGGPVYLTGTPHSGLPGGNRSKNIESSADDFPLPATVAIDPLRG